MRASVLEYQLLNVSEDEKGTGLELLKSLYVDNCVTSFNSVNEYEKFKEKSTLMLKSVRMDLQQWESNSETGSENAITNVLGYKWDKFQNELFVEIPNAWNFGDMSSITKSKVLSLASQVFDKIGFTSPAVLILKMLLQESWALDLKWDEEWNAQKSSKVKSRFDQIYSLQNIKVPRCAVGSCRELQLHVFTDASKYAYGGIVFVRNVTEQHVVNIQYIVARSRVAPLEKKLD